MTWRMAACGPRRSGLDDVDDLFGHGINGAACISRRCGDGKESNGRAGGEAQCETTKGDQRHCSLLENGLGWVVF